MFKNKWTKMVIFALFGGALGYAYYYFIGCQTGSCPLTSNPYITTGYGLGAGFLLGWDGKFKNPKKEEETDG